MVTRSYSLVRDDRVQNGPHDQPPVPGFPPDYPRSEVRTGHCRLHEFVIAPESARRIGQVAQSAGVTTHVAFLAASGLVFSVFSDQPEVAIATARASADSPVRVVRIRVDASDTFTSLLRVTASAWAKSDARGAAEDFDLVLGFEALADCWRGGVRYKEELFEEATICRLCDVLCLSIERVSLAPDAELGVHDLVPAADRAMMSKWNSTDAPFSSDSRIDEIVLQRAAACPDEPAVMDDEKTLTYGELARAVSAFAREIASRQLPREQAVGVCMPRSAQLVVALLGIMRADHPYLPLEADMPVARQKEMLKRAGVSLIVTTRALRERLSALGCTLLFGDDPSSWTGRGDLARSRGGSKGLAYVIHTSGSTGVPKGVAVEHQAVVNRLEWMQREYPLGKDDRVLQKTPITFDVSVWELFWPLMVGAQLVMARPDGHRDIAYLAGVIRARRITTLHFVPSMLELMLDEIDWASLTSLRRVFCSGEALSRQLIRRVYESGTTAELHNLYGPTEAAVDVSYWNCAAFELCGCVPIGKPIQNVRLHVLNARAAQVPVGAPGELYISGVALARGYLNSPELTQERFPALYVEGELRRCYRTGDRARWLADGNIEYLGRNDHQVKIHGVRIECADIEANLCKHPDVRQCVVIYWREAPVRGLVAYIVLRSQQSSGGDQTDASVLERWLSELLPQYMRPARYVFLSSMPLTSSGKLDRRALPIPE